MAEFWRTDQDKTEKIGQDIWGRKTIGGMRIHCVCKTPREARRSIDRESSAPDMGDVVLEPDARNKEIKSEHAHAASPPPTTGKHPPSPTSPDPERNVFRATVERMDIDRRLISPIPVCLSTPSETYPPIKIYAETAPVPKWPILIGGGNQFIPAHTIGSIKKPTKRWGIVRLRLRRRKLR